MLTTPTSVNEENQIPMADQCQSPQIKAQTISNQLQSLSPRQLVPQCSPNHELSSQIKSIIQQFYSDLTRKQLAQKVRTQIIPILIMMFFEELSEKTISEGNAGGSKRLLMNNTQLLNSLHTTLATHSPTKNPQTCLSSLLSMGKANSNCPINFQKLLHSLSNSNQNLRIEDLIQKVLAIFRVVTVLQGACQRLSKHFFDVYKLKQIRYNKFKGNVGLLEKYIVDDRIRSVIRSFNKNLILTKSTNNFYKILTRFLAKKSHHYKSIFLKQFVQAAPGKRQNQNETQNYIQIKRAMTFRGLQTLQNSYSRSLRLGLKKIRAYCLFRNVWRQKWVRTIAYRTPANLQTSLWRLINYCHNITSVNLPNNIQLQVDVSDNPSKNDILSFAGDINNGNNLCANCCNNNQIKSDENIVMEACTQTQHRNQQQNNVKNDSENEDRFGDIPLNQNWAKNDSESEMCSDSPQRQKISTKQQQRQGRSQLQCTQQIMQHINQAKSSKQLQSIIFTKEQKIKILWEELQYVGEVIELGLLIQGFCSLEAWAISSGQQINQRCQSLQQQNIQQKLQEEVSQNINYHWQKQKQQQQVQPIYQSYEQENSQQLKIIKISVQEQIKLLIQNLQYLQFQQLKKDNQKQKSLQSQGLTRQNSFYKRRIILLQ